jgi:hypothetical protein
LDDGEYGTNSNFLFSANLFLCSQATAGFEDLSFFAQHVIAQVMHFVLYLMRLSDFFCACGHVHLPS